MKQFKKLQSFKVQVRQRHKNHKFSKIRLQHQLNTMNFHNQPIIIQLDIIIGKLHLSNLQEEREALADKLLSIIKYEAKLQIEKLWMYRWAIDLDLFGELFRRKVSSEKIVEIFGSLKYQHKQNQDLRNESIVENLLEFSYESLISGIGPQIIESIIMNASYLIKVFLNEQFDSENLKNSNLNRVISHIQMLTILFYQQHPAGQVEEKIIHLIRQDDFICHISQLVPNNDACLQRIEVWLQFVSQILYTFNKASKNCNKKNTENEQQQSQFLICQITSPMMKMLSHLNFQLLLDHLLQINKENIMGKILSNIKLYRMLSSVQDTVLQNIHYFCQTLLKVSQNESKSYEAFELIFLVFNEQVYSCDQMCYLEFRKYLKHFYQFLSVQSQDLMQKQQKRRENILKSLPKLLVNFLVNQLTHDCQSDFLLIIQSILQDIPVDLLDLLFGERIYLESGQYLLTLLLNTKNKTHKRELCESSYYKWRILEQDYIQTSLKQKLSLLCYEYEIGEDGYLEYWLQNYSDFSQYSDDTSDKEQFLQ